MEPASPGDHTLGILDPGVHTQSPGRLLLGFMLAAVYTSSHTGAPVCGTLDGKRRGEGRGAGPTLRILPCLGAEF